MGTMAYEIHTDVKFGPLELVDVGRIGDDCKERWWNQSLVRVNDCVARLGVLHGEFHWHHHEKEDEFFYDVLHLDDEHRPLKVRSMVGLIPLFAVTTMERQPFAPDLPTMNEHIKGFEATSWHGVFAPAATPPATCCWPRRSTRNTSTRRWKR